MKVKTLVKLLITALLIFLVISRIDFAGMLSLLGRGNPWYLAVAAAAAALFIVLRWWKWHLLLTDNVTGLLPIRSLASYLVGTAAGIVTPGRVGELGRAAFFDGHDRIRAAGLVFFDRLIDLATVTAYALPGLFFINRVLGMAAAAGTILLLLFLMGGRQLLSLLDRLPEGWQGRLQPVRILLQGWGSLGPGRMLPIMMVSFLSFGVSLCQFRLLTGAIYPPATWGAALIPFPVAVLASAAPFTISGFGAREATAMWMMARFGVPGEVAVGAVLISFVFNVALPGLAGALAFSGSIGRKEEV